MEMPNPYIQAASVGTAGMTGSLTMTSPAAPSLHDEYGYAIQHLRDAVDELANKLIAILSPEEPVPDGHPPQLIVSPHRDLLHQLHCESARVIQLINRLEI